MAFGGEVLDEKQISIRKAHRYVFFMMMIGATIVGCRAHAAIIGAKEEEERAEVLFQRLNAASGRLPSVPKQERPAHGDPMAQMIAAGAADEATSS